MLKLLLAIQIVTLGVANAMAITPTTAPTLPLQFSWPSTQPIGIWHLSDPSYVGDENPSGWNSSIDGLPRFADNYLDGALPVLKSIGAQGVIIWDIEGSSKGESLQYIGDPTMAAKMNPGMDYNHFFYRIRSAGFIPGVCIRPTDIVMADHPNGERYLDHITADDPYANLERKIAFAREGPWKCKLFYIDSNVRSKGPDVPNAWVEGAVMPATIFARLHKRFPDCLLIPEMKDPCYHLWTIPYREAKPNQLNTPGYILQDIPGARSAMNLNTMTPDQIKLNWRALRANGSILMMNAWWKGDPGLLAYLEMMGRN